MQRHYACFLKRLRIFKIINLSQNASLQASIAQYLSTDADTVDASAPGFEGKLLLFFLRQDASSDQTDSIDFAYFPSARSGDAMMLLAYADGAYHMTGDPEFLQWRDQVLVGKTNANGIARTTGSLILPKACRSYYRDPNLYTPWMMRTLLLANDGNARAEAVYDWQNKLEAKEEAGLRDSLFTIPTSPADPNALYASSAPPVMDRPADNWIWEKDPFEAKRIPGDAGHQQYPGFIPDSHLILAWGPTLAGASRR